MQSQEHILLESDEREVPTRETARRIHARLVLRGGRWRHTTELALIDYYFLSVRVSHAQSIDARYVVDLRFVDPEPRLERRVAWPWLAAGASCLALAVFGASEVAAEAFWWRHEWLLPAVALFAVAAAALYAAIHLTTETLSLVSTHGRVTLVAHTGLLGTFREFRRLRPWFDAHLQIAAGARRRSLTEQLADEMREHFRLREAGALTEAAYEAAKPRILATHGPTAARAREQKAREALPGPPRTRVRA